jgi:hypothetical protein
MSADLLIVDGHYNGQVWGSLGGKPFTFDAHGLAAMRRQVQGWGDAKTLIGGGFVSFDESTVTLLIAALNEPEAESCHWCDRPGFYLADYQPTCEGHAAGFGMREDESA